MSKRTVLGWFALRYMMCQKPCWMERHIRYSRSVTFRARREMDDWYDWRIRCEGFRIRTSVTERNHSRHVI